jgi:hypothetical protein
LFRFLEINESSHAKNKNDTDFLGQPQYTPYDTNSTKMIENPLETNYVRKKKHTQEHLGLKLVILFIAVPVAVFLFIYIFNWLKRKFKVTKQKGKIQGK